MSSRFGKPFSKINSHSLLRDVDHPASA